MTMASFALAKGATLQVTSSHLQREDWSERSTGFAISEQNISRLVTVLFLVNIGYY